METWGQTQKVHEKEMSDEDARRVGQWTIGLAGGPRALPTLHGPQVFLGDYDWIDKREKELEARMKRVEEKEKEVEAEKAKLEEKEKEEEAEKAKKDEEKADRKERKKEGTQEAEAEVR